MTFWDVIKFILPSRHAVQASRLTHAPTVQRSSIGIKQFIMSVGYRLSINVTAAMCTCIPNWSTVHTAAELNKQAELKVFDWIRYRDLNKLAQPVSQNFPLDIRFWIYVGRETNVSFAIEFRDHFPSFFPILTVEQTTRKQRANRSVSIFYPECNYTAKSIFTRARNH